MHAQHRHAHNAQDNMRTNIVEPWHVRRHFCSSELPVGVAHHCVAIQVLR